jgi:hypothetical protein
MDTFCILKNSLVSEPVMAFPCADQQYELITDAAMGTAATAGGLGTILTQKINLTTFTTSPMHPMNSKTMKKIILHFYSNWQQQFGVWIPSMNTSKANNLFYSPTTNP